MFKKINDTQFLFNDEVYTVADGVTIEKASGIISLDKFSEENGLLNIAFSENDFKKFISNSYNGDENLADWLK